MPIVPEELRLTKEGETLTVQFSDKAYPLSAEYLRVCSPSAEVRGHGGAWTLVAGKRTVRIRRIEPIGSYAVRLYYSDGHHSGIYTWETLHDLAVNADDYWQRYLEALEAQGKTRDNT
ncbi:MAG: gamma-butyrobetaine hydroxylase-like domain-containing protein [Cardiobacteriaceae bacterium]|nr:gamma-butyrobetaine hydroxylase-like domain-containing protein [Cardiobacteriaceae bacterium]